MSQDKRLLDAREVDKTIRRIVKDAAALIQSPKDAVLVGIRTHGVTLAQRMHKLFALEYEWDLPMGIVDTTLYRDDLDQREIQPLVRSTQIDFDVTNRLVFLVDDVVLTGRTARCAIDAIIEFGRPQAIRLISLVDRGHRELPIRPDIVGIEVDTRPDQRVHVCFSESDEEDGVWLREPGDMVP